MALSLMMVPVFQYTGTVAQHSPIILLFSAPSGGTAAPAATATGWSYPRRGRFEPEALFRPGETGADARMDA
jgi:hypothetical protein